MPNYRMQIVMNTNENYREIKKKNTVFITGLTSTSRGGMEFHNLGNYVIVEPFFEELRKIFPDAELVTTLQLSRDFCERFNVVSRDEQRFWRYGLRTAKATLSDGFRVLLWKVLRLNILLKSPLLNDLHSADLVIDFSGDIYGDNAKWNKFLEGNARLFYALMLKRPVAMLIGSPGPFESYWRQWMAKRIIPKLDVVTNREPLSTAMLSYIGIKGTSIRTTACPSVLFKASTFTEGDCESDYDKIARSERPVAGFILCGWNMPVGPYFKWPREDWEFQEFVKAIDYLIQNTEHRICIMSHQNGTDEDGKLIKGVDHRLIERFIEHLGDRVDEDRVYPLKGLYDAGQSKAIISNFDVLISGRIHGAVQALSQSIPSVIIDYGHEPKPHKLAGFARMYGVDDYLVSPNERDSVVSGIAKLMKNKHRMKVDLDERVPIISMKAKENFEILKPLIKPLI